MFNPLDPSAGDLMKVAMAARLDIEFQSGQVWAFIKSGQPDYFDFVWDDHQSRPRNSSRSIGCASFSWRCVMTIPATNPPAPEFKPHGPIMWVPDWNKQAAIALKVPRSGIPQAGRHDQGEPEVGYGDGCNVRRCCHAIQPQSRQICTPATPMKLPTLCLLQVRRRKEMTPDEVNDACSKFVEHLRGNGSRCIHSH